MYGNRFHRGKKKPYKLITVLTDFMECFNGIIFRLLNFSLINDSSKPFKLYIFYFKI
ncbi:hypothetical protein HMPREF1863_00160 [Aedoeadaptatus coxii]|uniref:Uncharacterized protein n=1 Tax=Aedoeadaptatus coxii TaxID=755172 RepID=A0A134AL70_9FIRM|nr:hypothetical protein HMPREF1863_00160 [Peptoniphilus coxii]